MISYKKSLSIVFFLLSVSMLQAQDIVTSLLSKGDKSYNEMQYSNALAYYRQAYVRASKSTTLSSKKEDVAAKVADCYWLTRNYDSAYVWYSRISSAPDAIQYRKAELSAILGKYAEAASLLKSVSGFSERATGFLSTAAMKKDSADWSVKYLDGINTEYFREFSPVLVDSAIIWTTNQPKKFSKNGVMAWDNMGYNRMLQVANAESLSAVDLPSARKLYDPKKLDAKQPELLATHYALSDFDLLSTVKIPNDLLRKMKSIAAIATPVVLSEKFSYNIAHATYNSTAGQLYFSANRQEKLKNKVRTVGIVAANRNGATLSGAKFIFADGKHYSVMHPAVHANGTTLVFSSNMAGGKGGYDLYIAEKNSDSTWSNPVALNGVNSRGNELFPSFSPNGSLYFSTDGHPGLGGLDIYMVSLKGNNTSNAYHLPTPVNSSYDDFGFTVAADLKTGYFTSDRLGSDDIYKFGYEKKIVKVSGTVISEEINAGKANVKVILYEKADNGSFIAIDSVVTDGKGKYTINARPNREYRVTTIDPSGEPTVNFNTNNNFTSKSPVDLLLKDKKPVAVAPPPPPSPPAPEVFKYIIYFDFDQHVITSESAQILEEVKAKMNENADYKCSLYGHTDVEGGEGYNTVLSSLRSKTARSFLKKLGIDPKRVTIEFFGETRPVIQTRSIKEAKKNRRVEIEVTK
jgi:outer membrane protein OmpA-like peptidoglycan-associated protein